MMEDILRKLIHDAVNDAITPIRKMVEESLTQTNLHDKLLDTKAACEFLNTSPNTLQTLCIENDLAPKKLGRENRYWMSDLKKLPK